VKCGDAEERLAGISNCFVVDAYDAGQLASKALEVLRSNKRSNGREFTHEVSIPYIAERVSEVYKKAIQRKTNIDSQ
jgi:hypothetical protein